MDDARILRLSLRSDRKKAPDLHSFRSSTMEDLRGLVKRQDASPFRCLSGELWYRDHNGRVATVRINGRIKIWKRDSERFEIPVKFGMYEAFRIDTREFLDRVVFSVSTVEG